MRQDGPGPGSQPPKNRRMSNIIPIRVANHDAFAAPKGNSSDLAQRLSKLCRPTTITAGKSLGGVFGDPETVISFGMARLAYNPSPSNPPKPKPEGIATESDVVRYIGLKLAALGHTTIIMPAPNFSRSRVRCCETITKKT